LYISNSYCEFFCAYWVILVLKKNLYMCPPLGNIASFAADTHSHKAESLD